VTYPRPTRPAPTSLGAGSASSDRTVHASSPSEGGTIEIVRYDRQGRWYQEVGARRERIPNVHEAAQRAIDLEEAGGTIHTGRSGGQHFDAKVAGAKGRKSRR
jgi:hypothetical protein